MPDFVMGKLDLGWILAEKENWHFGRGVDWGIRVAGAECSFLEAGMGMVYWFPSLIAALPCSSVCRPAVVDASVRAFHGYVLGYVHVS